MNFFLVIAFIATVSFFHVDSAPANKGGDPDKVRLLLKIVKHQPCTSKPTPAERIRLPNLSQAPLIPDTQRGKGYYLINGPTTISKLISGTVQMYTETRFGIKSPPEQCQKADSSGCGGVGSCVICDICDAAKTLEKKATGLVEVVTSGGKALECQRNLKPGTYDDILVRIAMPTKGDLLKTLNIDEDFWEKNGAEGRMFFVTTYWFDEKVNGLTSDELQKKATTDNPHVIGCHKFVGTIYDGDEEE